MKNSKVNPTGLKGQEVLNRMRFLMGEGVEKNTKTSSIELTKKGPDGNIYGIVRENHEYYIKTVKNGKSSNLIAEDFDYIGGLQNKKSNVHKTYSNAIKQLNLKFLSINESFGGERVNVFENDNLHEDAVGGFGFVEEIDDNDGKGVKTDNDTSGDNLDGDFDENPKNPSTNTGKPRGAGHDEEIIGEDVELTEDEEAIDNMVEGLDAVGHEDDDVNNDGKVDDEDDYLKNKRLKISNAMKMDETEEKMSDLAESLSKSEAMALYEVLNKDIKKKV